MRRLRLAPRGRGERDALLLYGVYGYLGVLAFIIGEYEANGVGERAYGI